MKTHHKMFGHPSEQSMKDVRDWLNAQLAESETDRADEPTQPLDPYHRIVAAVNVVKSFNNDIDSSVVYDGQTSFDDSERYKVRLTLETTGGDPDRTHRSLLLRDRVRLLRTALDPNEITVESVKVDTYRLADRAVVTLATTTTTTARRHKT